jgi:hypothetical protein
VGPYSLYLNTTGNFNTAVGLSSLLKNTDGYANVALGPYALFNNTIGNNNVSIGINSLYTNTLGLNNVSIGTSTLYKNTTGQSNIAFGINALYDNTTGSYNIAIGDGAGFGINFVGNSTGVNNIFVGNNTTGVSATESNRSWIGNDSTTTTWLGGGLLLGTKSNLGYRAQIIQSGSSAGALYVSGSTSISGSLSVSLGITGSLFGTASWATNALTASSADNFFVRQALTASAALINGTITAQALVVQTVTSSILYSSGSNILGNNLSNTQTMTGSVNVTGSINVNGPLTVTTTTGVFLPPRMTETQRIALGTPTVGSMIYQTDATEGVWYYDSGSIKNWTRVLNHSGSQVISGSLSVTQGITGSLLGTSSWSQNSVTSSNFNGTASNGFVSNMGDTYTGSAKITDIVTLTSVEYAAIGSPSTSTLYVVI